MLCCKSGRMTTIPNTITKTPTIAQNINQTNFSFVSAHLPRPTTAVLMLILVFAGFQYLYYAKPSSEPVAPIEPTRRLPYPKKFLAEY
jgi:hypothetical protein